MSRFVIASLVFSTFSSLASAQVAPAAPQHFAQPPAVAIKSMPPLAWDRAAVRSALAAARAKNLAAFRAYQQKGTFPSNTFEDRKLNVWRDAAGHLCAAATIIDQSGQHELVQRVADQDNFIRLGTVEQGPLMDWILTSGFTQDEIAAIQEPFLPVRRDQAGPNVVDARKRSIEDARLRARYVQVTKQLVENEQSSLDLATDRLMAHPELEASLVEPAN